MGRQSARQSPYRPAIHLATRSLTVNTPHGASLRSAVVCGGGMLWVRIIMLAPLLGVIGGVGERGAQCIPAPYTVHAQNPRHNGA